MFTEQIHQDDKYSDAFVVTFAVVLFISVNIMYQPTGTFPSLRLVLSLMISKDDKCLIYVVSKLRMFMSKWINTRQMFVNCLFCLHILLRLYFNKIWERSK